MHVWWIYIQTRNAHKSINQYDFEFDSNIEEFFIFQVHNGEQKRKKHIENIWNCYLISTHSNDFNKLIRLLEPIFDRIDTNTKFHKEWTHNDGKPIKHWRHREQDLGKDVKKCSCLNCLWMTKEISKPVILVNSDLNYCLRLWVNVKSYTHARPKHSEENSITIFAIMFVCLALDIICGWVCVMWCVLCTPCTGKRASMMMECVDCWVVKSFAIFSFCIGLVRFGSVRDKYVCTIIVIMVTECTLTHNTWML